MMNSPVVDVDSVGSDVDSVDVRTRFLAEPLLRELT